MRVVEYLENGGDGIAVFDNDLDVVFADFQRRQVTVGRRHQAGGERRGGEQGGQECGEEAAVEHTQGLHDVSSRWVVSRDAARTDVAVTYMLGRSIRINNLNRKSRSKFTYKYY